LPLEPSTRVVWPASVTPTGSQRLARWNQHLPCHAAGADGRYVSDPEWESGHTRFAQIDWNCVL